MREFLKYNVDAGCLSEIRIPVDGHSVIKVPGEETCYYSGGVEKTVRYVVAITPNEVAQAALLAWMPT